ncbi:MAG: alkaline phosphatase PhoX [Pseudomonadota bacterium]
MIAKYPIRMATLALAAAVFSPLAVLADDDMDFSSFVEQQLRAKSEKLFGVEKPLEASAPATSGAYRAPGQSASDQVLVAHGLKARYLTREAASNADMMFLWPNGEHPTHLIMAIEEFSPKAIGTLPNGITKMTPSLQRVDLKTGKVETILRGLSGADGVRLTPWGTVLVTEEADDGGAYEVIDPLNVSNHTVVSRAAGNIVDANGNPSTKVVKRSALPTLAWEGIGVLPSGVVYAGDEERPGTGGFNADGGALFKFIPQNPRTVTGPIANLNESPLAAGWVFAMQVSCVNNNQQVGQGCEVGNAAWVPVNAASARIDANAVGATGYYRPEDLELDPLYRDAANPQAVRFCWTNTGNEGAKHYAEVMCCVDSAPLAAVANQRSVVVNRFVEGDTDANSFDNLAFQPVTGNLYVIEDHNNGDIWACLPDGADRDLKSDGCVKILSVKDSSAEPTGFFFAADGRTAFVSIQHSNDGLMPKLDDYGTDDILMITGFKVKTGGRH